MKKILLTIVAVGFVLFAYQANAAEIIPYGSFNYKWSNHIVNLKIMDLQSVSRS